MTPRQYKVRLELNGQRTAHRTGTIELTRGDYVVYILMSRHNSNDELLGKVIAQKHTKRAHLSPILVVEHVKVADIHFEVENEFGLAILHKGKRKYQPQADTLTVAFKGEPAIHQYSGWLNQSALQIKQWMHAEFTQKFLERAQNEFC